MSDALAGIAGMNVDIIVSRIPPDVCRVVDSIEQLAGPLMGPIG